MKSNKKRTKTKKKNSKIFGKRYYAWFALMLLLSTVSHDKAMSAYVDIRFLLYTIGLSVYAILFYFLKKKKTIIRSKTAYFFFGVGLLFIFWNIISAIGSISYYESLVPLAKISIFGLSVFFIMESLSEKNALQESFKFFTVLTFFHAVVALLQVGDIAFTYLIHGSYAPYGFTGNRNFLGGLLTAFICIPSYMAITTHGKWKWFSILTVIVTFSAIVFTQTRTSLVALMALLVLTPIGWIFIHGKKSAKMLVKPIFAGILAIVLTVYAMSFFNETFAKSIKERIGSAANISTTTQSEKAGSSSIRYRLKIWEGSFNIFKENPIIGVGPGNWKLAIPLFGKGASHETDTNEIVMRRPHNIYLNTLSELGFIGLGLYLFLIGIVLIAAFKFIKKENESKIIVLFLSLGIIAFLIDSLAAFSVIKIEHSFLFAFFFGALLSIFEKNNNAEKSIVINKNIILLTAAIILAYSITVANANFHFSRISKAVQRQFDQLESQRVIQVVDENKSQLIKLSQLGLPLELFSARAYRDLKMYDKALVEINSALKYHPNNSTVLNAGATIFMVQNKYKEAIPWLEKGINITPENFQNKRNLAIAYYQTANYKKAISILETFNLDKHQDLKEIYQYCLQKKGR